MTWVKGPNGIARWDGGAWPERDLYPEGQVPKRKPGRPRTAKCGTISGYHRHNRDRTIACEPCLAAIRDYQRERTRRRKEALSSHP